MAGSGWLTRSLADVPAGDGWLSARERARSPVCVRPRAGRAGASAVGPPKAAVSTWSGGPGTRSRSSASGRRGPGGARGRRARRDVAISLSHRRSGRSRSSPTARRAWDAISSSSSRADGLRQAPGSPPAERAQLAAVGEQGARPLANLIWTAKEAAAKRGTRACGSTSATPWSSLEWEPADVVAWRELRVRWERDGLGRPWVVAAGTGLSFPGAGERTADPVSEIAGAAGGG